MAKFFALIKPKAGFPDCFRMGIGIFGTTLVIV